jgi:hypothetical protein
MNDSYRKYDNPWPNALLSLQEQHKLAALFKEPEAGSCNGTVTGESTASNSAAGAGEEVAAAASGGGFSFGFKF